jgi:hypothetical protein
MLDLAELQKLSTPEGQKEFLALITEVRREAGAHWLKELKEFTPELCELADLVFNHNFEDAYSKVLKQFPIAWTVRPALEEAHRTLNHEFNKKRF